LPTQIDYCANSDSELLATTPKRKGKVNSLLFVNVVFRLKDTEWHSFSIDTRFALFQPSLLLNNIV
jgi:hypothetical protein